MHSQNETGQMFNFFERKQINTQAKRDLEKKLSLERTFNPEIKSLFASMNRDFRVTVAVNGTIPRAQKYKPAWETLLKKHYQRVQRAFSDSADDIKANTHHIERKLFEELLALALLDWADERSILQSSYITNTNQTNMEISVEQARRSLAEQDLAINNVSVAAAASAILKRKANGRVSGIETLETQAPAENTKLFNARAASGQRPNDAGTTELTKTWRTIGDKVVRVSHKTANFQKVNMNSTFSVGGSDLRYPGDNGLGAPIDETINCRCSAVYRK